MSAKMKGPPGFGDKLVTRDEVVRLLNVYHFQNHRPWYRRVVAWVKKRVAK